MKLNISDSLFDKTINGHVMISEAAHHMAASILYMLDCYYDINDDHVKSIVYYMDNLFNSTENLTEFYEYSISYLNNLNDCAINNVALKDIEIVDSAAEFMKDINNF